MIAIDVILEDIQIHAEFRRDDTDDGNMWWFGRMFDSYNGKSDTFQWTQEQMSAILSLGTCEVAENSILGYDTEYLYTVAENAIKGMAVRPIP